MRLADVRSATRWFLPAILILALVAACGDDDDSDVTETLAPGDDTTATTSTGDDTTPDADVTGTAEEGDATGTADEDATGTMDSDATGTADEDATGTMDTDATGTADESEESTGTADSDVTGTADSESTGTVDADDPLANLGDVSELDNFTLMAEGTFDFTGAGMQEFTMDLQRATPENYHSTVTVEGADPIEVWVVGDTLYVDAGAAGIQEMPFTPEAASQFDPNFYLTELQNTELLANAQMEGEEEINGRETTRYTMTAEQWAESIAEQQGVTPEGVSGEGVTFWVDNEENVLIRSEMDVNWTVEGEEFQQSLTWNVTDLGETAEVEPPSGN